MQTAQQSAQAGMAQSDVSATGAWKKAISQCVIAAATRKPEITVDDVWNEFDKLEQKPPVILGRSIVGPSLVAAIKLGLLKRKDGFSLPSQRPSTHGRLLRVFRSQIYKPALEVVA